MTIVRDSEQNFLFKFSVTTVLAPSTSDLLLVSLHALGAMIETELFHAHGSWGCCSGTVHHRRMHTPVIPA